MKKSGYPVNYEFAISDDQMKKIYEQALLSVFPSKTEGCGLPVLESIWAGLPVVASNIPSVVENGAGVFDFLRVMMPTHWSLLYS